MLPSATEVSTQRGLFVALDAGTADALLCWRLRVCAGKSFGLAMVLSSTTGVSTRGWLLVALDAGAADALSY